MISYSKIVLHPYYKLDYIKLTWGGAKEQEEEREKGNLDAKNWQDEARKILETTVSILIEKKKKHLLKHTQMEKYYQQRPGRSSDVSSAAENEDPGTILSEYDQYRQSLLNEDDDEGWNSEYRRYLKDRPADVKKDTDIVQWWQVHLFHSIRIFVLLILIQGSCSTLPDPCANCSRCPPVPSIFSPMRTTFLSQ